MADDYVKQLLFEESGYTMIPKFDWSKRTVKSIDSNREWRNNDTAIQKRFFSKDYDK